MTEAELQIQVADYLRLQYPDVLFHSDFGSGVKLTYGQAVKQKRQNGGRRAWPDMFIAEPRKIDMSTLKFLPKYKSKLSSKRRNFHGLMIELKRDGAHLMTRKRTWASDHIKEQAEMLNRLQEKGYFAVFACGFDEAKEVIDRYLGK